MSTSTGGNEGNLPGSPSESRTRPILLRVNVQIPDAEVVPLFIRQGDDPTDISTAFGKIYALSRSTTRKLADHIHSNLKLPTPSSSTTNDAVATEQSRPALRLPIPSESTPIQTYGVIPQMNTNPSMRSSRGGRFSRLYEDAMRRQDRLQRAAETNRRNQQNKEEAEATFRPHINQFRSSRSPQTSTFHRLFEHGAVRERRLGRLREARDVVNWRAEEKECTFRPQINEDKTEPQFVKAGLNRQGLFLELYRDAERRERHRMREREARDRPKLLPRARSLDSLVSRLPSQGLREHLKSCFQTLPVFRHPPRQREGLSLCDWLYRDAEERKRRLESMNTAEPQKNVFRLSAGSLKIFQQRKETVFSMIWGLLGGQDGSLKPGCVAHLARLKPELVDLVKPVVEFVESRNLEISYRQFIDALEIRLANARGPTGHLFTEEVSIGRPAIAVRRSRSEGPPIYQKLADKKRQSLENIERLREVINRRESASCTFQPNLIVPQPPLANDLSPKFRRTFNPHVGAASVSELRFTSSSRSPSFDRSPSRREAKFWSTNSRKF